jgi:hypothetical protein
MPKVLALFLAFLQVTFPILMLWGAVAIGSLFLSGCEVARYAAECGASRSLGCS